MVTDGDAPFGTRVTIEQVATEAGVSRSTVSRVVNGSTSVSADAKGAVLETIARLGYVPNRAARSLASRRAQAIALVVPEDPARMFEDPVLATMVSGVYRHLHDTEFMLTLLVADKDPKDKMINFVRTGGVDGAIVISHHQGDDFVQAIADSVTTVFAGRPRPASASSYVVDCDGVRGAADAAEYLLGRGYETFGIVAGPPASHFSNDRIEGFQETLATAGVTPAAVVRGDFTQESGGRAVSQLIATNLPRALFVLNDLMARGVVAELLTAGLHVPRDVAVIGFDDSWAAVATQPQLTTVRQPASEIGETAARVLLDALAGLGPEKLTMLPTELIVRDSA